MHTNLPLRVRRTHFPCPSHAVLLFAVALFGVSGCGGGGEDEDLDAAETNYSLSGSISGLAGNGLTLSDGNGNTVQPASGATQFAFASGAAYLLGGASYSVTVASQPSGLNCAVSNGSGTISANISNVSVACTPSNQASAALVSPAANEFSWNINTNVSVALSDPLGNPVSPVSCTSADSGIISVTADCSAVTLKRLGNQTITVSGGGYSAPLSLRGVPQRHWSGLHGSTGFTHLAAMADGRAFGWGGNNDGVLAQNKTFNQLNESSLPLQLLSSTGSGGLTGVYQISASDQDRAVALTEEGSVWTWGGYLFGVPQTRQTYLLPTRVLNTANNGALTGAVQVEAGDENIVALLDDGRVISWGNYPGQGPTVANGAAPGLVVTASGAPLNGIAAISAGWNYTLALTQNGTVYSWGYGNINGSGRATLSDHAEPVLKQDGSPLSNIVAISAGYNFVLALDADGSVWAWGNNLYGQLGQNDMGSNTVRTHPVRVLTANGIGTLADIVMVAAGGNHALAMSHDGKVWAWGYNPDRALGGGLNFTANQSMLPRRVVSEDGLSELTVTSIAAGYRTSAALTENGTVLAWGSNQYSQLGRGVTYDSLVNSGMPGPVRNSGNTGSLSVGNTAVYSNLLRRGRF